MVASSTFQGRRRGFRSGTTEGRCGRRSVRPKVGAAEGRCGRRSVRPKAVLEGGRGDLPRENFVKRTQNPAFWKLLAHFWRRVQSSRVQYSVRLQMHNRSTSTSLEKRSKSDAHTLYIMHRWILIFLLRFCTFRTDHTFRKVVRPWSYQS